MRSRCKYLAGLRAAAPHLGPIGTDELVELRAVGVTPVYIEKLRRAGYGQVPIDKLVEMRAVGV